MMQATEDLSGSRRAKGVLVSAGLAATVAALVVLASVGTREAERRSTCRTTIIR